MSLEEMGTNGVIVQAFLTSSTTSFGVWGTSSDHLWALGCRQRRVPVGARMPNFPIQSAAAIKLATEAAKTKCKDLAGRGFYKVGPPIREPPRTW